MAEIVSRLTIYVTQPGDTALSIAQKYKMKESDLLKFNPLLKHKQLKPGYPLNILISEQKEEIFEQPIRKDSKESILFPTLDQELALTLVFYIKETQYARIFAKEYYPILRAKSFLYFEQLMQKYEHLTLEGNIDKLHTLFEIMFDAYIDFKKTLDERDTEVFKKYQNNFRKHYENFFRFLYTLDEKINNEDAKHKINDLYDLFNLLVLKIFTKNFVEAEEIFQKIIFVISSLMN